MYSVRFYKDKDGNEPLKESLKEPWAETDKDSRINFNKIRDYIKTLSSTEMNGDDIKDYMSIADTKQKEMIKTDEYKKADYDTKQKQLTKARSDAKKKAVQNIMSKTK